MDIYHWPSPEGNFGDDLNIWIWDFLLPQYQTVESDTLLVGVGTVLDKALLPAERKKLIIGSGVGYGEKPDITDSDLWDIRCVRGPLSAEALGLDPSKGILDPAAVISDMEMFQNLNKTHHCSFVPHWESALHGQWDDVCKLADVHYIDPCEDAHSVITSIAQSKLVIAESMHGAIIADAFRVPWIAVSTSGQINSFKWQDWAASLELEYQPHSLPLSSPLEAGAKGQPYLGLSWPEKTNHVPKTDSEAPVPNEASQKTDFLKDSIKALLRSPIISWIFIQASVWKLKKISSVTPQLSDEQVYLRQKQRFYDVIESVRKDIGL